MGAEMMQPSRASSEQTFSVLSKKLKRSIVSLIFKYCTKEGRDAFIQGGG